MKTTLATLQKHGGKSIDAGFNTDSRGRRDPVFYYFGEMLPERRADDVDKYGIRHNGWYTFEHGETYRDGSGLAWGIVAKLPAMPGFPDGRFLAGYCWGDNDERVLWPELFADEMDAARMADEHARVFAELQRGDDVKFNTARDIESSIEDALHRLRECLAMRHRACLAYVRDEIRELCETIRKKRETLATEYADYV